jgi:hypothetical protein
MKNFFKLAVTVLFAVMTFCFTSCGDSDSGGGTIAVTGITLDKTTLSLEVGGTDTLTFTITPKNATNNEVTWESNKPAVASVMQSGLVTAHSDGQATITVTTKDGNHYATCVVTVATPLTPDGLAAYLASKPSNTPATAYPVKLTVTNPDQLWSVKDALIGAPGKYVILDLTGSAITEIPEWIFGGDVYCITLAGIIIPNSVTSIGDGAFCRSGLISVIIPSSVTSLGKWAFLECASLTSVTIGSGVKSIEEGAFAKSGLVNITIPDSVTSLGKWAFGECAKLASVTIGNGVTSIGEVAFVNCSSLASVTIGNGVNSIGESAFNSCTSLTSVTIPSSVTSIGEYAFSYCFSITRIAVDPGIITYSSENGVLYTKNNTYLIRYPVGRMTNSFTIPNSVTSIGESAFASCTSLASITIPSSVTSIGNNVFHTCTSLVNVTIPSSVTSIGQGAFFYCSSLTSITIPDSVETIGNWAFIDCAGLTSITIGSGIKSLGEYIFGNDTLPSAKIASVTFRGTLPASVVVVEKLGLSPNLISKFKASGPGTYVSGNPGDWDATWTKQ